MPFRIGSASLCYSLRHHAKGSMLLLDYFNAYVGVAVKSAVCSICGADKSRGYCEHRPGRAYDGTLCTVELSDPTEAYEASFVAVPAQREAGVIKCYAGEKEGADTSGGEETEIARKKKLSALIALEDQKFIEEAVNT